MNAYAYAGNNPVLYVDPMGELPTLAETGKAVKEYWAAVANTASNVATSVSKAVDNW